MIAASSSYTAEVASPPVPAVAARLKAKRRTMNLVNPADPDDFSTDSMPSSSSLDALSRRQREVTPTITEPMQDMATPLGVNAYGVKGILRPAGTPGSGNGVRWFPKNRFRVITPREELGGPSIPQKQPPAPPAHAPSLSASTSFFSQLLSVMPAMSPRRAPPTPATLPEAADESWERPGEEGEISLIASSTASGERSTLAGDLNDSEDGEDGEAEGVSLEVPWTGPALVHSSPLFMPTEGSSRDISIQDIAQPAFTPAAETSLASMASVDEWNMRLKGQEDVSNLLSTSLPEGEGSEMSFSMNSMAGPSYVPPHRASLSPSAKVKAIAKTEAEVEREEEEVSGVSWMRADQSSLLSIPEEDDNPTIRRKLSPRVSPDPTMHGTSPNQAPSSSSLSFPTDQVDSPIPIRQNRKAFTSIFADMSAEQAELSWPLSRATPASNHTFKLDETTFHSALSIRISPDKSVRDQAKSTSPLHDPPTSALSQTQSPAHNPKALFTPISPETGNITEFFDTTSSLAIATPCPTKPSALGLKLTALRPTSYSGSLGRHTTLGMIAQPTQALFDAQQSHTSAISSELEMYRKLAMQLGKEVEERDKALADLNIRLVETEMRSPPTTAVGNPQPDLSCQSTSDRLVVGLRRKSLSPSPTPSPLAAKSAQAGSRYDGDKAAVAAAAATAAAENQMRDLEIRLEKALAEQRVMSEQVRQSRSLEQAQAREMEELQDSVRRMEEVERDRAIFNQRQTEGADLRLNETLRQLDQSRDEVNRVSQSVKELEALRKEDDEEIRRLSGLVEKAREGWKREEKLSESLERSSEEVDNLKREGREREAELERERTANDDLETMIRELKITLNQAQDQLSSSTDHHRAEITRLQAELNRLRSDSSNKDLEILNLQRRKNELKEDREMLNIALDSKQQEVELLKRKLARRNQATPLGISQRQNIGGLGSAASADTPLVGTSSAQTPAASNTLKLHPSTVAPPGTLKAGATQRRVSASSASSAVYATPLQTNGRTMRSGAVLVGSTAIKDRVMRRDHEVVGREDVRVGAGSRRVSKRESILA